MVHYKKIVPERWEDAPFLGCLISATDCHYGCDGCFNQHLKDLPTLVDTAFNIIRKVKSNPFHQGIILGGLEWTLQIDEAVELIEEALKSGLSVMVYTGSAEIPEKLKQYPIYVKCGRYDKTQVCDNYSMFGVKLASKNQIIYKL